MGFAIFLSHRRDSLKSGGTQTVTTNTTNLVQWSFWPFISPLVLMQEKKNCKQIMGKLSDLEDLIKHDCNKVE